MVEGESVETVTEEILFKCWKSLQKPADFFKDCKTHAINYIFPENYERKYYFFDCEDIAFQNEQGKTIWSTSGSGEMDLPAKVGVYIVRGKMRGK